PLAIAVAISGLSKFDEKKTTRVCHCSDLIVASNCGPVRSPGRDGSRSAKSGDRSRTISMHVLPSRQLATTLKSLSFDKMLFRPYKTTGQRSTITRLTQCEVTEDSVRRCPNPTGCRTAKATSSTQKRHVARRHRRNTTRTLRMLEDGNATGQR